MTENPGKIYAVPAYYVCSGRRVIWSRNKSHLPEEYPLFSTNFVTNKALHLSPGSLGSIVHYDYDGVRTVRASMVRYRTLITPVARLKHIEKVHHTKGHFSGLLLR
jgi:hypothetical protein